MRISSQMQNTSFINMQNSEQYKNYFKNKRVEDKSEDSKEVKHITNNVVVEKKDDLYVLSKIDDDDKKTLLSEVKAKSKNGLELSKYFKSDESSDLTDKLNQVNHTIRSMSLTDYI